MADVPNSSSPVVVWRCDDCGWTILDDDAVDGQSCEAWLDGETEEHGPCLRLVMVPAEVTDEMVERGTRGLAAGTWTAPDGTPCRPDEIAHAVLAAALSTSSEEAQDG